MDLFDLDPEDPEFEIRIHDFAGNNSYFWERQADTLLLSAQILNKHLSSDFEVKEMHYDAGSLHTMLMLRGFAVECLFKAIYIHQGKRLFEDGQWATDIGDFQGAKDHRLHKMAQYLRNKVGIAFDRQDIRLLEMLCYAVVVTGRYPVPDRYDRPHKLDSMTLETDESAGWQGQEDEARFHRILRKIKSHHGPLRYHGEY